MSVHIYLPLRRMYPHSRFRFLTSDTQSLTDVPVNSINASDVSQLSASVASKPPLPSSPQAYLKVTKLIQKRSCLEFLLPIGWWFLQASRIHDPASEYQSKMRMPSNVMNVEITHLEMEGDMPPVHAPPILPVAQRYFIDRQFLYSRLNL